MAASMGAVLHWDTLEQRKHKGQNLYYDLFHWKLLQLPPDVHRFCDPLLSAPRRKELLHLLRSLEEESSCQRLQILFSFSVPSPQVLDLMCALHCPLVSAGAGTGYWEFLLQSRGLDVVAFDQNQIFPPEMRYTEIMTGGPELLENYPDRALFLAWPDADGSYSLPPCWMLLFLPISDEHVVTRLTPAPSHMKEGQAATSHPDGIGSPVSIE
ncbi:uncharacterized protein LOC120927727 isoform X3 [Rana temporaria]|uniref:uncharacterized protein LOC120927727 isoform X3 n=1 Tax=Rana temporaria TaxID=8407 RepID=UPI001AAD0B05|nr:uncharacterized protein LOC120927727 isoform X3 [Rana temporaria]